MSDLDRREWIGLRKEDPLDSQRRIVDAGHHLYRDSRSDRPAYLLEDLLADTRASHNVTETVFVECKSGYRQSGPEWLRPVGETIFVADQARESESTPTRIAAIVAFADLRLGEALDEVLEAHEVAGDGRLRGIRQVTASDPSPEVTAGRTAPPPNLMADPELRCGLSRLGDRGLSFDAWVYHPQLHELADLARAVPGTTIVLNHLGGPLAVGPYRDRVEVRLIWRKGLRDLARCPNVAVKLGGIGMDRIFANGWASRARPPSSDEVADKWGDDVRWCIDLFDPSRCMFESNYPVDRNAIGYTVLWNAFQKMAAAFSADEQDSLFAGTAARIYHID